MFPQASIKAKSQQYRRSDSLVVAKRNKCYKENGSVLCEARNAQVQEEHMGGGKP